MLVHRYIERVGSSSQEIVASGHCDTTTAAELLFRYKDKRVAPTITVSDQTAFDVVVAGTSVATTALGSSLNQHIPPVSGSGLNGKLPPKFGQTIPLPKSVVPSEEAYATPIFSPPAGRG